MLRVEKLSDRTSTILKLSGRLQEEYLPLLHSEIQACQRTPHLDLTDVKLVDRPSIRFLVQSESEGVRLLNCPLYIQEWISRERSRHSRIDIE
jgi:ABC-type transporter Mla MlaB component